MECQDILEQTAKEIENASDSLYHLEHRDGSKAADIQP